MAMSAYININTNFDNYKTKFIKTPMEILENKSIKPVDKLVYILLRNKLGMSIEHGYYDEQGYYIFYTQDKLGKEVGVTTRTIINSFQRLKEAKLIEYTEDGKANKIYLCEYSVDSKHLLPKKEKIVQHPAQEPIFSTIEPPLSCYAELYGESFSPVEQYDSEIISCYSEKNVLYSESFSSNSESFSHYNNMYNTNYNNPNKNYNNSNNNSFYHSNNTNNTLDQQRERVKAYYYDNLDMAYLQNEHPHEPLIEDIFNIILEMHMSEKTRVNGEEKDRETIRAVLARLNHTHIEDVVNTFRSRTVFVEFPRSYIKTLIYDSAITLSAKTANRVMHDSYNTPTEPVIEKPSSTSSLIDKLIANGTI